MQATDHYLGTLGSRVVLIDGPDAVRATVAASWLLQLGLHEVYVYAADPAQLRIPGLPAGP